MEPLRDRSGETATNGMRRSAGTCLLQWSRCVIAAERFQLAEDFLRGAFALQWSRCVIAAESFDSWDSDITSDISFNGAAA